MLLDFFQLGGPDVCQLSCHELQLLAKLLFIHGLTGVCIGIVVQLRFRVPLFSCHAVSRRYVEGSCDSLISIWQKIGVIQQAKLLMIHASFEAITTSSVILLLWWLYIYDVIPAG